MEKIVVYTSPGCGRCQVFKNKLTEKGLEFEENTDLESLDFDLLVEKGIQLQAPVINIDGEYFNFGEAVRLIDEL